MPSETIYGYLEHVEEVKEYIFNDLSDTYNLNYKYLDGLHSGVNLLASPDIHKITNHPVHINDGQKMSPSAFIPFCEFQGNITVMSVMNDHFDVPVCSSFQAKILKDKLCYEVDPNKFKNQVQNNFDHGIIFLIDTNIDRQILNNHKTNSTDLIGKKIILSHHKYLFDLDLITPNKNSDDFMVYLETLGMVFRVLQILIYQFKLH